MFKKIAIFIFFSFEVFAKPLIFGLNPYLPSNQVEKLHEKLRLHLETKLQTPVILTTSKNYKEQIELLETGKIDIAAMSPNLYHEARQMKKPFIYLATVTKNDNYKNPKLGYKGVIFTLKGSGIKTFEDLKGKRFGFTDRASTSGYVCPRNAMLKHGIDPDKDLGYSFLLKKHSKILSALLQNSIDAGATYDRVLQEAILTYGDVFHLLYETPLLPYEAYVVSNKMDKQLLEKIREALFSFKDSDAIGEAPARFDVIEESLYDQLCI
jgi:phosphonate transport system substrate-binding protein